jgi:hypothetical protein
MEKEVLEVAVIIFVLMLLVYIIAGNFFEHVHFHMLH